MKVIGGVVVPHVAVKIRSYSLLQAAEAKAICRRCPVIEECLTWALDSGQDLGVWGGQAEDERRVLKQHVDRNHFRTA
jgi:WhiB family redox-sensing transcriptional regulator